MNISMNLVYQYTVFFFHFSPTSNHFHPLQVENCDSNLRLVVDENENVKSGLKELRVWGNTDLSFNGMVMGNNRSENLDVYGRQILTAEVDSRTERVKYL